MKPRKSISVDFRPSKTRDDGTAVQIERDCSIEIGAVSQHMGFTQPGKNFSARMPVSIAHSALQREQVASWVTESPRFT